MLTLDDLRSHVARLAEVGDAHVLLSAPTSREIVLQAGRAPVETVVAHATVPMLQARRADKLAQLRDVVEPTSVVLAIRKKAGRNRDHVVLGRASTADIVIPDHSVSQVHAHFLFDVDESPVSVIDINSTNGTFLNRQRLQAHMSTPLTTGDCLRFGQSVFYFLSNHALRGLLERD